MNNTKYVITKDGRIYQVYDKVFDYKGDKRYQLVDSRFEISLNEIDRELTPLQAFNRIDVDTKNKYVDEFIIIQKALKNDEKYKKAVDIIKTKGIDILELRVRKKAKTYNEHTKTHYSEDYTDEEFDLLKEIF